MRFATVYLTPDARTDRSAADARVRAAKAAGTVELQQRSIDEAQTPPRNSEWSDLQARGVHLEATPLPYAGDALPPDSTLERHRAVSLDLTEVAADGTRTHVPELYTIECTLTPTFARDGSWLVDAVQLTVGASSTP